MADDANILHKRIRDAVDEKGITFSEIRREEKDIITYAKSKGMDTIQPER